MKKWTFFLLVYFITLFIFSQANALTINTNVHYYTAGPDPVDTSTASSGFISSYVEGNIWSTGYASAQAYSNGTLAVSTSCDTGVDFDAYEAKVSFSETYTNESILPMDYFFDFSIPVYLQQIYGGQHLSSSSSCAIEIIMNGINIWESTSGIWGDRPHPPEYYYSSNMDFIFSDNCLYDSLGDPLLYDAQLSGLYSNTFYLGLLKPGEQLSLEYIILSRSSGLDSGQSDSFIVATGSVYSSSCPVPEPTTMLLLGSGLIGLVGLRKKLKK